MASTVEAANSASSPESYAFLNHSADTLSSSLPPSIDDKPLARQKRKRTSAEDAIVLENAYQRDPKPDKSARLELVKQVALGEKEVQIWFQNRRQTSRRKSRPLLPHEIAQMQVSRSGTASEREPTSVLEPGASNGHHSESERHLQQAHCASLQFESSHRNQDVKRVPCSTCFADSKAFLQPQQSQRDAALESTQCYEVATHSTSSATSLHSLESIGFLANRRSVPLLRQSSSDLAMLPPLVQTNGLVPQPRKLSSFVRLSMNAEGKAEVVTKDASSPSPPRPQQVDLQGICGSNTPNLSRLLPRDLQRSSSGRSRDSRAWEFWCDKEARSELGNAAEKDASGSAVGAIGLLRTVSGRNVLSAVPSKRNSFLYTQRSMGKRSKLGHKRLALQRSSTSMGRLQGREDHSSRTMPKLKHYESAEYTCAKDSDSDKENWSPSAEVDPDSEPGRGQVQGETVQNRATEQRDRDSNTTSQVRRCINAPEVDPENDEELAMFMRGCPKTSAVPGNDDFDCVQGLLSLSQGNWR